MKTQIFQMIAMATMLLMRTGSANACQADDVLSKPAVESTPAPQQVETERQYRGGSIIIRWSDTKDELSGFSNKTGRWQKLKIQPMEKIEPNAVEFVGAVRIKEGIAAYSGETGTWDVVHLPETSTATPAVSPDVVQFKEGDHFYAFAAATGRWTSPTDPALKPITGAYQSPKQISQAELYSKLLDWLQTVPASEFQGTVQYLDGVVMLLPRTKEWQTKATAVVVGLDSSPRFFREAGEPVDDFESRQPLFENESDTIKIERSETRNEFYGFSKPLKKGEALPTGSWQTVSMPIVGTKVAMISFMDPGKHQWLAGFSSETGTWDVVDLGDWADNSPVDVPTLKGLKLNDPQTSFKIDGHKYSFSAGTGRWSSPTDPELQEQNRTLELRYPRTSAPTVFVDVNNRMKQFETWRDSLPAYKRRGILLSVTSRASTGTAMLSTARLSWMTELEAKVRELFDVIDPGEENGTSSDVNPDADSVQALEQRIEGLRTELSTLEQNVRSASQSPSKFKSETNQRHELRKHVEQSFDLRQQLQELEAQRLRVKLQQVENNLAVRAKLREAIVDRRLRELFNTTPLPEPSDKLAGFDGIQLLAFHTSWDQAADMKTIWDNLLRDGFPVEAVNINEERGLAIQYKISSVPTSVLVVHGKEVKRFAGQTSERELKRCLNEQRDARRQTSPTPEVTSAPQPKLGSDPRIQWPQPTEIAKELRNMQGSTTRYIRQSERPKKDVVTWSQPLEKLISEGDLEPGSTEEKRQTKLNAAQDALSQINSLISEKKRDWDYGWSAYQTQLQLLRLDVAERSNEKSLADLELKLRTEANVTVPGAFTPSEIRNAEAMQEKSRIELQRAEQVLKLYADIEAKEPELNPIFVSLDKKPAVNTTTDSAVPTTESTSGETPEK